MDAPGPASSRPVATAVDDLELLARGREADVYALDADRVLRRRRAAAAAPFEARLMTHVREAGYPAPEVHEASGPDLVMRRLHGPTLQEVLLRGGTGCGAVLAEAHNRLHALAAPDWLPRLPAGGDRIAHLDLHPGNIIVTGDGPVVIDWTNACAADPAVDVAATLVLLRTGTPGDVDPEVLEPIRQKLIDEFLDNVDTDPAPRLRGTINVRMNDPRIRPAERQRMREWLSELEN